MKKSLIAIAILGAAAFSAQAANVTLYGTVDAGFAYNHVKVKANGQTMGDTINSFKMADGLDGANKIGIKGEEDLGNMKVGFKLENDFKLSNGNLGDSKKLFQREARMYVKSQFGEIGAGRFGGLASAAGSYDIFFANADAFDGGDNEVPYAFSTSGRYDNSIAYQSPEIAGFQGTLMYSFQEKGDQADKMKNNNRYIGAGLTYNIDALNVVGVFEGHIRNKDDKGAEYKNGFTYNLGANYDFGVAKAFVGGQYAKDVNFSTLNSGLNFDVVPEEHRENVKNLQVKGYAFTLGAQVPVTSADKLTVGTYYGSFKNSHDINSDAGNVVIAQKDAKTKIYGLSARFEHNLSKRSSIYAGAGYGRTKIDVLGIDIKKDIGQVYMGLHHNF